MKNKNKFSRKYENENFRFNPKSYVCKKQPFGSAEVSVLWDKIDAAGGLEILSQVELCTFVMTMIQHATFCRFSDVQNLRLSDLIFELDYLKMLVRYYQTRPGRCWPNGICA
jgi:hypothetical protein